MTSFTSFKELVERMKKNSLRRKVFNSLLLPIGLAIAAIGCIGFYSAREEVGEVYDAQLITAANVLWALMEQDVTPSHKPLNIGINEKYLSEEERAAFDENADGRMFRVWQGSKIIISSEDSIPESLKALPPGFSEIKYDGDPWRIYSLHIPERKITVELGEELGVRHYLVNRITLGLVLPLLVVFPAIAFLIWRGVGKGLTDVGRLSEQVQKRSSQDLSPLKFYNVPVELSALAESLNSLLHRLEESFLREKRFTENAAHELKTPLAVLKIQAQLALSASTGEIREHMEELIGGVERASRLVEELLILAKNTEESRNFSELDLYVEAGKAVARFAEFAVEKGIEVILKEETKTFFIGSSEILSPLIGNILDNAIKYTPSGGHVEVTVTLESGRPALKITDDGPGIPPAEYEKVFERFYRGESRVAGSGLGLAIAKSMAENLGAEINLAVPESTQGLKVTVVFPKN